MEKAYFICFISFFSLQRDASTAEAAFEYNRRQLLVILSRCKFHRPSLTRLKSESVWRRGVGETGGVLMAYCTLLEWLIRVCVSPRLFFAQLLRENGYNILFPSVVPSQGEYVVCITLSSLSPPPSAKPHYISLVLRK